MVHPPRARRWRLLSILAAAAAIASCGGSGGGDGGGGPIPRLAPAVGAQLAGNCADVAARMATALPQVAIERMDDYPQGAITFAGQAVRHHCVLLASMDRRIGPVDGNTYMLQFEMRLPADWNGRFLHQGNGGLDGVVQPAIGATGGGPLTHALQQGFAVLSSDAGHPGALGPTFGLDPQARLDYGYRAVEKLTPLARRIIALAYDKEPDRAYFAGCSNGGRHAMVAATRFASQYDGILAGAPGHELPRAALANMAGAQLYAPFAMDPEDDLSTAFTTAERKLVGNAVLARCDALDGLADGLVQDVEACRGAFDLQRDVPTCAGVRNGDGSCLAAAQKTAIARIFSGPTLSNGQKIYSSFPYDPGIAAAGIAFWEFQAPLLLDPGALAFVFGTPPEDPNGFLGPPFALGADLDTQWSRLHATTALYPESGMRFMTPPEPTDMGQLRARGGKIMVYHGAADPIFSVDGSAAWITGLRANDPQADRFARLYVVPGMGHCEGGPATDQFDMLSALVEWVEYDKAPEAIVATARGRNNAGGANGDVPPGWSAARTRPLCPHPRVARYAGGEVEAAASFRCER